MDDEGLTTDEEVPSPRDIEIEIRFRRVHGGTLETVRKNRELLQVRSSNLKILTGVLETSGIE